MGLKDQLLGKNSGLSLDGITPSINPGATKQSKMHASGEDPGYSLGGAFKNDVDKAFQAYNDGVSNNLPSPSQLDRKDGSVPPSDKYLNNLPE